MMDVSRHKSVDTLFKGIGLSRSLVSLNKAIVQLLSGDSDDYSIISKLDLEDTLDDRAASLPKLIRKFLQA